MRAIIDWQDDFICKYARDQTHSYTPRAAFRPDRTRTHNSDAIALVALLTLALNKQNCCAFAPGRLATYAHTNQ